MGALTCQILLKCDAQMLYLERSCNIEELCFVTAGRDYILIIRAEHRISGTLSVVSYSECDWRKLIAVPSAAIPRH